MSLSESDRLHHAGLAVQSRRTPQGRARVSRDHLRIERERCLEALKRFVDNHGANGFSEKATILLTRHWVQTPWRARAELLQAADWLIRVGAGLHR